MCFFTQEGSYITNFMMPNIFCQSLHYSFLPLSLPLSSCIREKSLSLHFYVKTTVPKCFTQLKGRLSKIEPPFIRYGFFFLCCYSKQISCLSICLMTLIIFFSKTKLSLYKSIKYFLLPKAFPISFSSQLQEIYWGFVIIYN